MVIVSRKTDDAAQPAAPAPNNAQGWRTGGDHHAAANPAFLDRLARLGRSPGVHRSGVGRSNVLADEARRQVRYAEAHALVAEDVVLC